MADFSSIVRTVRCQHRVRVRKWRANMSGRAWQVEYRGGRVVRWIEAPFPRTALSLAIFLHEIGHHVIGFDTHRQRCEEELHAWKWALDEMRRHGVEPDARTLNRFRMSMQYAVAKALRRGLRSVPASLREFLPAA